MPTPADDAPRLSTAPPGAATIQDVAARAGVSVATVSNVVSGNRRVGAETRRRVLEAIAALGYQPNRIAASLRSQKSRMIGVVVPDVTNPFFAAVVRRIEELAAASGYDLVLVTSNEDAAQEHKRVRALVARRIDGLIAVPVGDDSFAGPPAGAAFATLPPTVVLDRGFGLAGFDSVASDGEAGSYAATHHLVELGHAEIALLATTDALANVRERIAGYRRALAERELAGRARIVLGGMTVDGIRAAIEQELRRADPPTAIFATSNLATLGAIKAVRALDLEIPEDVSLVGFDDLDWMTVLRPYVTTVAQATDALAEQGWRLLMARLAGTRGADPTRVRLPCALRVRESTRPANRFGRAGALGWAAGATNNTKAPDGREGGSA